MPPKGSSKRKAAEALPAAVSQPQAPHLFGSCSREQEAVPAAEPAAAEESTGRRSGE